MIGINVHLLTHVRQWFSEHMYWDVVAQQTVGFLRILRFSGRRFERTYISSCTEPRLLRSVWFMYICVRRYIIVITPARLKALFIRASHICFADCYARHLAAERLVHESPKNLTFSRRRIFAGVA